MPPPGEIDRHRLPFGVGVGLGLAVMAVSLVALADEVPFGANDVATVFFISKSNDKNRVDYGVRLDTNCIPIGSSAVFGYWRDLEHTPVRTYGLSFLDKIPYGISSQGLVTRSGPTEAEYFVRLRQFERTIAIATKKDGTACSAVPRATIKGGVAQLVSVYAKLAGPFSVEYIDIHGKDFATGAEIVERVLK